MRMIKTINKANIKKFSFIILDFIFYGTVIMITWLIWARFIVECLPKFIPFALTLSSLCLLISACIIYVIILKQLLRPRASLLIQTLISIWQKIFAPIYTVDLAIRANPYVRKVIYKIVSKLSFHLLIENCYEYYRVWNYTPRLLLIFIFYVDVFYFHKLGYFYSFLFLSAIPLMGRYLYHLMEYLCESEIQYLEQWYKVRLIPTDPKDIYDVAYFYSLGYGFWDWITIRDYLSTIRPGKILIKYKCEITPELSYKYFPYLPRHLYVPRKGFTHITPEGYVVMSAEFDNAMPAVINLYLLVDDYTGMLKSNVYSPKMKRMNIIIFSLFLVAWLYILVVSLPTFMLTPNDFEYLAKFQERLEPFSSILI